MLKIPVLVMAQAALLALCLPALAAPEWAPMKFTVLNEREKPIEGAHIVITANEASRRAGAPGPADFEGVTARDGTINDYSFHATGTMIINAPGRPEARLPWNSPGRNGYDQTCTIRYTSVAAKKDEKVPLPRLSDKYPPWRAVERSSGVRLAEMKPETLFGLKRQQAVIRAESDGHILLKASRDDLGEASDSIAAVSPGRPVPVGVIHWTVLIVNVKR